MSTYHAERLDQLASREFCDIEEALAWCGLSLSWSHVQPRPGRTLLTGCESGKVRAVVTGPLLAVLPEIVQVEVIR